MKVINVLSLTQICEAALDGEPVFIIRAQDIVATEAIKKYLELSKDAGGANTSRVQQHLLRMTEWRARNQNKLKSAD